MQLLKQNFQNTVGHSQYACFRFGPFKESSAITIATSIRRALFQSVPSTAIIQVVFQYPTNEFSSLSGIQESTLDFLLNLKKVVIQGYCEGYVKGGISKKGPGIIKASDLFLPYSLSVANPDQYIGTITTGFSFHCDFILTTSKGIYFPIAKKSWLPSSSLFINADFSPITQANFRICEDKRQEWVEFEISTNGAVLPSVAFRLALVSLLYEFQELYTKLPFILTKPLLPYSHTNVEHLFLPISIYQVVKHSNIETQEDFFSHSSGALHNLSHNYKLSF